MKPLRSPWVVIHDCSSRTPYRVQCRRCGSHVDPLPKGQTCVEVNKLYRLVKAWSAIHEDCKER
jgi:hypothetical protein